MGSYTDGKSTLRIFGFDSGVRRRLLECSESPIIIVICGCEVKKARRGDDLEVR